MQGLKQTSVSAEMSLPVSLAMCRAWRRVWIRPGEMRTGLIVIVDKLLLLARYSHSAGTR
jgi:hypothetical protein